MTVMPQAVLFDFDGTLVHIAIDFQAMRSSAVAVIKSYGEEPIEGMFTLELVETVRDKIALTDPQRAAVFYKEALASIEAVELAAAEKAIPLPTTIATLHWLKRNDVKIGIVTRNCTKAVQAVAKQNDMPYDVLVTRDNVKHVKPNPEHLWKALSLLNAEASSSLMVGDHPTDITAAHAAGMAAVGITVTRKAEQFDVQPEFIIDELADLFTIIESGAWQTAAQERGCACQV